MTSGPKPRNVKKSVSGQLRLLPFGIMPESLRESHAVSKDPEGMRGESELLRKLNSKDEDPRCKALTTLARHGGPGAINILAGVMASDCPVREKILALEAVAGIARRTRMYYNGIQLLESTYLSGNQYEAVRKKAKRIRDSICGERIINTFPGSKLDDRILI